MKFQYTGDHPTIKLVLEFKKVKELSDADLSEGISECVYRISDHHDPARETWIGLLPALTAETESRIQSQRHKDNLNVTRLTAFFVFISALTALISIFKSGVCPR